LSPGSVAGPAAFSNIAVYAATKAAISGFAGALRAHLSPWER
jgi:short-subunit dehydrogenase